MVRAHTAATTSPGGEEGEDYELDVFLLNGGGVGFLGLQFFGFCVRCLLVVEGDGWNISIPEAERAERMVDGMGDMTYTHTTQQRLFLISLFLFLLQTNLW